MFKILAGIIILLQISCANQQKRERVSKSSKKLGKYSREIKRLEKNLDKQAKIVESLRSQNERLRLKAFEKGQSLELIGGRKARRGEDLGEAKLFGTFLNAHNTGRFVKSERAFRLLEKTYPNSPLLAEAIYLRAKSALEKRSYKSSLKQMNRLIKNFPSHTRARSAMLAKSVIYRRLKLKKPSISVLNELMRRYPKSDEAKKAKAHLALLKTK